jgi:hypothetical protein
MEQPYRSELVAQVRPGIAFVRGLFHEKILDSGFRKFVL